jgi:hypothetical protein
LNESTVFWDGFVALGMHTNRGGEYVYGYPLDSNIPAELASCWPELFSFLGLRQEEREAAAEATFKGIAVTAVALHRCYPSGMWAKPVKLISTRGVQSLRLNAKGEVRVIFTSRSVQSHASDEENTVGSADEEITAGSVCSAARSKESTV